jgi:putative flippase GtrA
MGVIEDSPEGGAAETAGGHALKIRFVLVGALNTAVGLGIYPVLMWALAPAHVSYMVPMVMSHPIGIAFSYTTNKLITFRTRRNILAEFSKFGTFYLLLFLANLALLPMCVEWLRLQPVPSQIAIALLGITMSYFWHSRITFKSGALRVGGG